MGFQKGKNNFAYKHGLWDSPEYDCFQAMHQRCENPKAGQYSRYGARGIKVCPEWETFEGFITNMGFRPTPNHSLDRINNDGDYTPKNCRWATAKQQSLNRRNNRRFEANGYNLTITEWGEKLGIKPKTIWERLRNGWDMERAIFTPPRKYR